MRRAAAGLTSGLVAAVILVACSSSAHSARQAACPQSQIASCGRLIVDQRYIGGVVFTEGAVSKLRLTGARTGTLDAHLHGPSLASTKLLAGHYRLHAVLRPCDANCSHLDSPIPCAAGALQIIAHQTTTATVVVAQAGSCHIATTGGKPRPTHPHRRVIAGVAFVAAAARIHQQCQQTANKVGYAVPCPTLVPRGLAATPRVQGCSLGIVGAGGGPHCARSWRGWIVGSSQVCFGTHCPEQHLVVLGAPRVVRNPAKTIDGPGMLPGSRVQSRGSMRVDGRPTHWYFVPPSRNQGSAFAGHLVLVWNASGHTYAYGFHVVTTFAAARKLDLELVRHLVTVPPS